MTTKPRPAIVIELAIGAIILVVSYLFFGQIDMLELIVEWSRQHEEYELDEIVSSSIVLVVLLLIFAVRRYKESIRRGHQLQKALNEIKTLKGIIPICSYCKCIRDDEGSWSKLETYIHEHSGAEFSHGLCPNCYEKQMNEIKTRQKS